MRRDLGIDVAHRLLREKGLIGVLPDGNLIFYPLDDFKLLSIISEIYHKKIYDVREIRNFNFICDVGAHIGLFTLRISKQAPNGKIISIEANPTNFKFLLKNVLINGLSKRVYALNIAAGQRKGRTILWLSTSSRGDSSTKRWHNAGSAGHLLVDMLPLDDLLPNTICDLMKIDVEGAETDVLRGLEKCCTKIKRLVMEIHIPVVSETEIYEWLHNHDFVITKTQKLYEDCLLLEAQHPYK